MSKKVPNRYLEKVKTYDEVVIYGAGKIGEGIFEVLKENNFEEKILCFAVSQKKVEDKEKNGIPVKSIYDIVETYKSALFLLAVADKNLHELKNVVKELNITHYMVAKLLYAGKYYDSKFVTRWNGIRQKVYCCKETGLKGRYENRVMHITYCVAANAGDTLLSKCVRKYLQYDKWNIKNVSEKVDDKLICEINQGKGLLIGGGGLFLPDTNANKISGWQWAISEEQLAEIKVPIVVYSVGYNYFKGQENTELFCKSINQLVEKSQFVGLRNRGSVASIQNILRDDLKDKVCYQPCTTTLISKIYSINKKRETGIIGINIAFDREERRYGDNRKQILMQIAQAVSWIEKRGYKIWYLVHCDMDLRFLPFLDNENVSYVVKRLTNSLPHETIDCYKKIDLVLGMRGHAQMVPFGVGCRIITLGSHDKMRWFLEDIDALDWYIDVNEDIECLAERIEDVFKRVNEQDAKKTDERLVYQQEKLWMISCENRERILQIIKDK